MSFRQMYPRKLFMKKVPEGAAQARRAQTFWNWFDDAETMQELLSKLNFLK